MGHHCVPVQLPSNGGAARVERKDLAGMCSRKRLKGEKHWVSLKGCKIRCVCVVSGLLSVGENA